MTENRDFTAADTLVRGSAIVDAIDAVARVSLVALRHSTVLGRITDLRARYRQAPPVHRLRAVAGGVITAAIVQLVMTRWLPLQVAPATPVGVWVLVAAAGMFAALCANYLVIGWESSLLRRLGRAVWTWARTPA